MSEALGELGVQHWANIARRMTVRAAETKAWRIRDKASRALQEVARELIADKGYIIATDSEILTRYNKFFRVKFTIRDDAKRIWAVTESTRNSSGKVELSIVCVR